jgi:hypothetical protein
MRKRSYYCRNCGAEIGPHNHVCSMLDRDPRYPFCDRCGGTLRTGFITSAQCDCHLDLNPHERQDS